MEFMRRDRFSGGRATHAGHSRNRRWILLRARSRRAGLADRGETSNPGRLQAPPRPDDLGAHAGEADYPSFLASRRFIITWRSMPSARLKVGLRQRLHDAGGFDAHADHLTYEADDVLRV